MHPTLQGWSILWPSCSRGEVIPSQLYLLDGSKTFTQRYNLFLRASAELNWRWVVAFFLLFFLPQALNNDQRLLFTSRLEVWQDSQTHL